MRLKLTLALAALSVLAGPGTAAAKAPRPADACIYTQHRHSLMRPVEKLLHRRFACVVLFNDASPDWTTWARPWFLYHGKQDLNWRGWVRKPGRDRRLIVTQNMFPASVRGTDWRHAGARGDFVPYAKRLARNLVKAGAGNSVIRLGHEANGTWYPHSLGDTLDSYRLWREFWRKTVISMRSVKGAHFQFDWCINAHTRSIPLRLWYPGDDVVDIVGLDAYDAGIHPGLLDRWRELLTRTLGIGDVAGFARRHHKPLSFPEWGMGPRSVRDTNGGDDPTYVEGLARIVRTQRVAYQSYFYAHEYAMQLRRSPRSLAVYRKRFGEGGDSAAPSPGLTVRLLPRRPRAGRVRLRIRVRSTGGHAVPGATVRIAGRRVKTNRRGLARLRVRLRARSYVVRARLSGMRSGRVVLRARAAH